MVTDTAQNIVNSALDSLGQTRATIGQTQNANALQMTALLNALGDDLCRTHDWQFLLKEATFTGDGVSDTFDLPDDFLRYVNQTLWDVNRTRPSTGVMSPQQWGWLKHGIVSSEFEFSYRISGNKFQVHPVPPAGTQFSYYYIQKNWVVSDTGVEKDKVSAPSDIPKFNRRLMCSGLAAKFWGQKGLDTTLLLQEFNYILANEKSTSGGASCINLSGSGPGYLIGRSNVPESGYGS